MKIEHVRRIVDTLAITVGSGPVFYVLNKCVRELDVLAEDKGKEAQRAKEIELLDISVRLSNALADREIRTVGQLELMSAADLLRSSGPPASVKFFGKKMLREVREVLASVGLKLKGDS